jgi:hypothetical protein
MAAQTVLEELTRDELTPEHVRKRVDDWAARIESLYAAVASWLPSGWAARRSTPVKMHEEPMKRMGLAPRELPTLELLRSGVVEVTLRPYGLWIVGANGRLELVKGRDLYVISDRSETFEPPSWHLAAVTARRDSKPFDAAKLQALLAA